MSPPEPMDFTGVVYPKKEKPRKRVDAYDLLNLPTRILLSYLDGARASGQGGYDPTGNWSGAPTISIEDIKAELAKRPHVHNKKSGSEARRKLAQANHGPKTLKKKRPRTSKQRFDASLREKYPSLYG